MAGLLDFLATAGPIATQAGGDLAQGQANADQTRIQQAIQTIQMQRQAHEQMLKDALTQAQTGEAGAHSLVYQHEAQKLQPGDAGYVSMMGDIAGAQKAAEWVTTQKQLDAEHQNRLDEIAKEGGNALAVAQENARDAAARQVAQQTFIAGQNDKNRAATATNEAANRTATATNQANAQKAAADRLTQTQSGEIEPIAIHALKSAGSFLGNAIGGGIVGAPTAGASATPSPGSSPSVKPKTTGDPILDQYLQPLPGTQ
jgi:hypothetical protein